MYLSSRSTENTVRGGVNNVELGRIAESAGIANTRSTQHFWALNINPQMLSSTFVDELGYLPIDKIGADMLFQVISQRYEHGSLILTTNQPYKSWAKVFNNDATLTSAVLDRLLHHAETVVIDGKSYRMKDQIENPE